VDVVANAIDASSANVSSATFGSVNTDGQTTNPNDRTVSDPETSSPATFVADDNNVGLALQLFDDGSAVGSSGYSAGLDFLAENGNRIGHWSGDNTGDVSLYTRDGPLTDDTAGLTKALNVNRTGAEQKIRLLNIDDLEFRGQLIHHLTENPLRTELGDSDWILDFPTTANLNIRRGDSTSDASLRIQDENGATLWRFLMDDNQNQRLRLLDRTGSEIVFIRHSDDISGGLVRFSSATQFRGSRVNFNQNPVMSLREVTNAGPGDLDTGEWAFDTDRGGTGTPAWVFKDSGGTGHYWDADGTL
jgi:hypothetical protein